MKKFFIKLILLFVLVLVSLIGLIILPLPKNSYNLAVVDKNKMLEDKSSPKLIIAGGSNCAFGIDSSKIQKALNMPVVNMGVHANFGLGRILDDITPYINSGDILLIIPEYDLFTYGWNGDSDAWTLIFNTGFIRKNQYRLLLSKYYGLPNNFGSYLQTKTNVFVNILRSTDLRSYKRNGFDEFGDEVAHLQFESVPITTAGSIGSINQSYLNDFTHFVEEFSKMGVTVLLSYPSYDAASFDNSIDVIAQLNSIFQTQKDLTVISTPENYRMLREDMYDTTYHLNAQGREIRTAQLIKDLEAWKALCADRVDFATFKAD
jgi:hypothetical protein